MNIFKSVVAFVSRLSKRERMIFYVTISIIALVFIDRLILTPIFDRINNLSEAIRSQEEAIEQSQLIVTQEKRIKRESSLYTSFLSKPQAEEKAITAFLKEVETLAKKSSVYLIDIKPSGKDLDDETVQYFVKLNFEAQMEQVINFFYNVNHFEQLIKIESYQIQSKSTGSSVVVCSATISKSIISE